MDLATWSLVLTGLTMLTLVDAPLWARRVQLVWKNRRFLWNMYWAKRSFGTLNQVFLAMTKEQMGIPYTLDEAPWQTYLDVKNTFLGQNIYWPYLTRLDSTTTSSQLLTDQDATVAPREVVNFSSYSYVGAVKEQEIIDYTVQELTQGHYAFGNHGPRMLGGNNYWIATLEQELARFTGREAALVFSSGFLACKTAIQALLAKGDLLLGDGRLHESLRDGIRCAAQKGAKTLMFRHNDFAQLEHLLQTYRQNFRRAYVVVESVYSMDGDFTDLVKCQELAQKYDCRIILDEAHGLGILGQTGRGLEEVQNCRKAAWLVVGSLTKALGSVGGYVCGSRDIVEFLHFFATGTMFSAPLSVPNCIAAYKTLRLIDEHPEWLQETRANMDLLTDRLKPLEAKYRIQAQTQPGSPLVAFILRDFPALRVFAIAKHLADHGFYVAAVNPPACPLREPRLRLTAPRGITRQQIIDFAATLDQALSVTAGLKSSVDLDEFTALADLLGL